MKYYGKVGFGLSEEHMVEDPETGKMIGNGVWVTKITEKYYSGDILRFNQSRPQGSGINKDINLSNQISILADPFARFHSHEILYVSVQNSLWNVTSVDASQYPRLILEVGGLYNGEQV